MKKEPLKLAMFYLLMLVLIVSTAVYIGSMISHIETGAVDAVEFVAYLAGYVLTDVCLITAICEFRRGKRHNASLWLCFTCMALRLVYDILTVVSDGIYLSGLYQMDVFLILDALLLVGIVLLIKKGGRAVNLIALALTLAYLIGEAAGYTMKTFDDYDEFVMIFSLLAVLAVPLYPSKKSDA